MLVARNIKNKKHLVRSVSDRSLFWGHAAIPSKQEFMDTLTEGQVLNTQESGVETQMICFYMNGALLPFFSINY